MVRAVYCRCLPLPFPPALPLPCDAHPAMQLVRVVSNTSVLTDLAVEYAGTRPRDIMAPWMRNVSEPAANRSAASGMAHAA